MTGRYRRAESGTRSPRQMFPELFDIPVVHITVRSHGLMIVLGFLLAVVVIRRLSRDITPNPQMITNGALYALITGIVGARAFFVIHRLDDFRGDWLSAFAIWHGGLELFGGALPAVAVILLYLVYHKLPIRRFLDIVAIGLMLALVGRVGCFLNGCCWGKPTDLPWGVRFPYGSFAYRSQISPDPARNRQAPRLDLPAEYFFGYLDEHGHYCRSLKPWGQLTAEQKEQAKRGPYRCLPVHPTQLYTVAMGVTLAGVLYLFWRRSRRAGRQGECGKLFVKPGSTFALMFILYGIGRFWLEHMRDDNPFELGTLTISQLISIVLIASGTGLMALFAILKPDKTALEQAEAHRSAGAAGAPPAESSQHDLP